MTTLSETEGRVKITGSAAAESDISKFLSSLESSDYFSNVLLNTIEQVEEEGIKPNHFPLRLVWMCQIFFLHQKNGRKR